MLATHGTEFENKTDRNAFPLEKERQVIEKAKEGYNDAVSRIIDAYQWLVRDLAKRFESNEYHLADLVRLGNDGLKRAITMFSAETGHDFATVARWWVRQSIVRHIVEKNKRLGIIRKIY